MLMNKILMVPKTVLTGKDTDMKKVRTILALLSFLMISGSCISSDDLHLSASAISAKLLELKPLPKVHYTTPYYWEDFDNSRLYQLARITHALSVSGEWTNIKQIDRCVYTCARLNKTKPAIQASICVNFSPWHRRFKKDLPSTDRGPTYREEISYFQKRALLVKQWVKRSNEIYGTDVRISAINFDSERFSPKKGNRQWNKGMRHCLDVIHKKAVSIFPEAKMIWYGRGIQYNPTYKRWEPTRYWTGEELNTSLTCALYTIPETEQTHGTLWQTIELAKQKKIADVVPYVALASGYHPKPKGHYWKMDWPYDLKHSYDIGKFLNTNDNSELQKGYDIDRWVKVIIFYPTAFNHKVPDWPRHFIAYVRGATGVKDLKDLGYEK